MILLQLTVLGYLNTGKTTLINSIMNNDIIYNYTHTNIPMIYYKVHKEKRKTFCVEIEDTCLEENLNRFTSMLRKEITAKKNEFKDPVFSYFEVPSIPFNQNDAYSSISYGRMAYFLVFDLTNQSTFDYVKMIYSKMASVYDKYHTLKPFISLVGNKCDLVSDDTELIRQAEDYANENMVQLWLISSYTGKNVKKLFQYMINMVYNDTNLWKYDLEETGSESSES